METNFLAVARAGDVGTGDDGASSKSTLGAANPSMLANSSFLDVAGTGVSAPRDCCFPPKRSESPLANRPRFGFSSGSVAAEVSSSAILPRPRRRDERFLICMDRRGDDWTDLLGDGGQETRRGDDVADASTTVALMRPNWRLDRAFLMPPIGRRGEFAFDETS